jgi:serine protease Do
MNPALKPLPLLAVLLCLLTACSVLSRRAQPQLGAGPIRMRPIPPKVGEPINPPNLVCYFEMQSSNLLQQARLNTNLLRKPLPATCSLKLAPAPARVLAPGEMAAAVEKGVAVVGGMAMVRRTPRLVPTASGFFLTTSGALVTCWHVINSDKLIGLTVLTRDGRVCPVSKVLAVNTNSDLAILQVEGEDFTPLPVVPTAERGSPVWVLGNPFPWYWMLTSGIVSGYYNVVEGGNEVSYLCITADFAAGSSGGPVLNQHGAVVGVAQFRQDIGIPGTPLMLIHGCIPSSVLLSMIKQG